MIMGRVRLRPMASMLLTMKSRPESPAIVAKKSMSVIVYFLYRGRKGAVSRVDHLHPALHLS